MKVFLRILAGLGLLVVALIAVSYLLPGKAEVSRSITIDAPAEASWGQTTIDGFRWGKSSSDMAALTFQRPVRVMIHADRLVG